MLNCDDVTVKTKITMLIKQIDTRNNMKHEWKQFEVIFNEKHQNFISRIKETYPELTSKDLRFCAYIRMNMGTKEIAQLLNITDKGVEKSRWRRRKKFGIETGVDLNHFNTIFISFLSQQTLPNCHINRCCNLNILSISFSKVDGVTTCLYNTCIVGEIFIKWQVITLCNYLVTKDLWCLN